LLSGLLLYFLGADWRTILDLLVVAGGLAPSVVQRTPRLYFAWSRLKYRLTNVGTSWNLGVRLNGDFHPADLERFARQLAADSNTKTRLLDLGHERVLLHYGGLFTIELMLTAPDAIETSTADYSTLTLAILDQQVSYRASTVMLEDTLIPLIERIQKFFPSSEALYSLRIRFDGHNPFFGLYVQQMRQDLITDFQFEFHLPSSEAREYVRVGKDQLTIVSGSLDRFRRAVISGLTFSTVGA
jgi:hypothetical protein